MREEYWVMILMTGCIMGLLSAAATACSPHSRGNRWMQRLFWAFTALFFSGQWGLVPLNVVNTAAVAILGLPGYALLFLLTRL